MAKLPIPIVIVGGGRWGKVWASVITAARGSGEHLAMVARTDFDAARAWAAETVDAAGVTVYQSISQAVASIPELKLAIVCSRPSDHLKDSLEAFDCGLHVLVEKPIATRAAYGIQMVQRALQAKRKLAVVTEFAFIPALHQCVRDLSLKSESRRKITIYWHDPESECRYGSTKVRHAEVDVLTDLLPHALSIFSTVAPSSQFQIADAWQSDSGSRGHIRLRDVSSSDYLMVFDLVSSQRRRVVEVVSGDDIFAIDFSSRYSSITINGRPGVLDPLLQPMNSTLRLQLGALISEIVIERVGLLEPAVQALINIQTEIEDCGNRI